MERIAGIVIVICVMVVIVGSISAIRNEFGVKVVVTPFNQSLTQIKGELGSNLLMFKKAGKADTKYAYRIKIINKDFDTKAYLSASPGDSVYSSKSGMAMSVDIFTDNPEAYKKFM